MENYFVATLVRNTDTLIIIVLMSVFPGGSGVGEPNRAPLQTRDSQVGARHRKHLLRIVLHIQDIIRVPNSLYSINNP